MSDLTERLSALIDEWNGHCDAARDAGNPPPQMSKRYAARTLARLLVDAPEGDDFDEMLSDKMEDDDFAIAYALAQRRSRLLADDLAESARRRAAFVAEHSRPQAGWPARMFRRNR